MAYLIIIEFMQNSLDYESYRFYSIVFKTKVGSGSDMDAVLGASWPVMELLHGFMY